MLPKQTCAKKESIVVLVPLILSKFAKVSGASSSQGASARATATAENVIELKVLWAHKLK